MIRRAWSLVVTAAVWAFLAYAVAFYVVELVGLVVVSVVAVLEVLR